MDMDDNAFWQYMREMHIDVSEYHQKIEAEFLRLLNDKPLLFPETGDEVVVAAGLLSRGHLWIRVACRVLQVGSKSVLVESVEKRPWREWIDPILITDIVRTSKASE